MTLHWWLNMGPVAVVESVRKPMYFQSFRPVGWSFSQPSMEQKTQKERRSQGKMVRKKWLFHTERYAHEKKSYAPPKDLFPKPCAARWIFFSYAPPRQGEFRPSIAAHDNMIMFVSFLFCFSFFDSGTSFFRISNGELP